MTERSAIDPSTADRLARLSQRRSDPAPTGAGATAAPPSRPTPSSPAANSKIVAAGASAAAVLGLMAVFGHRATATGADGATTIGTAPAGTPAGATAATGDGPATVVVLGEASDPRVVTLAPPASADRVDLAVPAPRRVEITPAPAPQATTRGS